VVGPAAPDPDDAPGPLDALDGLQGHVVRHDALERELMVGEAQEACIRPAFQPGQLLAEPLARALSTPGHARLQDVVHEELAPTHTGRRDLSVGSGGPLAEQGVVEQRVEDLVLRARVDVDVALALRPQHGPVAEAEDLEEVLHADLVRQAHLGLEDDAAVGKDGMSGARPLPVEVRRDRQAGRAPRHQRLLADVALKPANVEWRPVRLGPHPADLAARQGEAHVGDGKLALAQLPAVARVVQHRPHAGRDVEAEGDADALDLGLLLGREDSVAERPRDGLHEALPREYVVGAVGQARVEAEQVLELVEQQPLLDREAVVGDGLGDGRPESALVGRAQVGRAQRERRGDVAEDAPVLGIEVAIGEAVVEEGLVQRLTLGAEREREVHVVAPRDADPVGRAELAQGLGRRDQVVELHVGVPRGRSPEAAGGFRAEQVERSHSVRRET
ncbi:MAG: hypothetical protein CL530_00070, partial [Aequorivita sp.]|nr:hypothetical protein [Aequorivita sp.]